MGGSKKHIVVDIDDRGAVISGDAAAVDAIEKKLAAVDPDACRRVDAVGLQERRASLMLSLSIYLSPLFFLSCFSCLSGWSWTCQRSASASKAAEMTVFLSVLRRSEFLRRSGLSCAASAGAAAAAAAAAASASASAASAASRVALASAAASGSARTLFFLRVLTGPFVGSTAASVGHAPTRRPARLPARWRCSRRRRCVRLVRCS
jgi:hypothetical protein